MLADNSGSNKDIEHFIRSHAERLARKLYNARTSAADYVELYAVMKAQFASSLHLVRHPDNLDHFCGRAGIEQIERENV
jgi:hypothetical protein